MLSQVIDEGPSAHGRRAIATPVFGGMIAAALLGIFLTPSLYVGFRRLREKVSARNPQSAPAPKAVDLT